MLSRQETRLLVESTRQPWSSAAQLAVSVGMERGEAASNCEKLDHNGLLQHATQSLSHLPSTLYAPTDAGIAWCIRATGLTKHQLGLTPERFGAMRAGLDVTMEINAMCAMTALGTAPQRVVWETFIQRRNRKRPLFLHGRIAIYGENGVRAFYLLNDRGEGPVTAWYRFLHYFSLWTRRQPTDFPPVLILTTRPFRAWAMLALARISDGSRTTEAVAVIMACADSPPSHPKASLVATIERAAAIRQGLQAVSGHGNGWQILLTNNTLMTTDPFAYPPTPVEDFERSVHAIRHIDVSSQALRVTCRSKTHCTKPNSCITRSMSRIETDRRQFNLSSPPDCLKGIQAIEAISDNEYRVLSFLCRHPVCPASTVAVFTGLQDNILSSNLANMLAEGLIAQATVANIPGRSRRILPTLWMVTEQGMRLRALRSGLDPDLSVRRYGFFASDHVRRPYHTLAAHRFFEGLKRYCQQRSRATRFLDAIPGEPNDGQVGYYDLAVYDAEMAVSDHYLDNGQVRMWRPDGYGALRCGTAWTRFWLEIDGTSDIRSRSNSEIWFGKLGGLCDYYCSMRWTLRYLTFPRLLIVTTNEHNLPVTHDALVASARGRQITQPHIFMAHNRDVARYGAMARIWRDVVTESQDPCYAFDNALTPGIVQTAPRRLDLIADLNRASEMGLLALPQPLRKSSLIVKGGRTRQVR